MSKVKSLLTLTTIGATGISRWSPRRSNLFRVAHTHYDTIGVAEDVDSVLAIHRLQEMVRDGIVAEALTPTYSFMGYIPDPSRLTEITAPEVASRLKENGVDGVVIGTT